MIKSFDDNNKKISYVTPDIEVTVFRTISDIMDGHDGDIHEEETHFSGPYDDPNPDMPDFPI